MEEMFGRIFEILLTAVCTSILTFTFGVRLYKREKKVELKTQYLINAWFKLEKASNRDNFELNYLIEEAIAEIQLFGTSKQIMLAQEFVKKIGVKSRSSVLPLLEELRMDLRRQLDLEQVDIKSYISYRSIR